VNTFWHADVDAF